MSELFRGLDDIMAVEIVREDNDVAHETAGKDRCLRGNSKRLVFSWERVK